MKVSAVWGSAASRGSDWGWQRRPGRQQEHRAEEISLDSWDLAQVSSPSGAQFPHLQRDHSGFILPLHGVIVRPDEMMDMEIQLLKG